MAKRRLLAPDFARGSMLLMIVLSNSAIFMYGADRGGMGGHPAPDSAADGLTQFLMIALLDVRSYPLFAFLVGYGIVQAFNGRMGRGASRSEAYATVQRRNRWLIAFGFVHAALLLGTEVLAAYGIVGLILCTLFLRGGERRLRIAIIVGTSLLALVFVLAVVTLVTLQVAQPAGPPAPTFESEYDNLNGANQDDYLISILVRLGTWGVLLFMNSFGVVMPTAILIGVWAARNRVIEEPERHGRLLRAVAVGGVALGLAGSLPGAFKQIGVFETVPFHGLADSALGMMAWTSGLAGGLGYAALFVLIATHLERRERPPLVVTSVAALGKRSLSGYLSHSIVMAPVLSAWGLGLGGVLSSAGMALFAIALWLGTVVVATGMERRGVQGPFERLLRHVGSRGERRSVDAAA
ncbi:DUF418 domain-containing protein [Nocardiopsis sp. MG754419]|uniref:DUF418 domain-containing protein n=1 Tax=Nocardiopsis sp. MG754419 TaxID=2259865 RepID=UPI001BA54E40|nr:DUF418 domain-containing protein [Nocardiopsis sp. MG754419]MBR8742617.1 hypothetical protein [Nocardiopsis sp. MG754419]